MCGNGICNDDDDILYNYCARYCARLTFITFFEFGHVRLPSLYSQSES
jgi:hypothetical protein